MQKPDSVTIILFDKSLEFFSEMMNLLNSGSRSPSIEGGTSSRSSANASTSIDGSYTSDPSVHSLGSKKRTTADVDYEKEMDILTLGVIRACSTFISPLTDEQFLKVVFVRRGKFISREAGLETTHDLQIAVLVTPPPMVLSEFTVHAIAELFAAV